MRRVRSRAPLRLSFSGGGTDVLPYAADRGGVVLNATIDRYAYASLLIDGRRDWLVRSLDYDLIEQFDLETPPVYDGKLDLVKAACRWLQDQFDVKDVPGCELHLHTDAPPGSGLGSSSAVVVALLKAFADWHHIRLTSYEIADLAYVLEREDLGIRGGMQDQYAASFGGFNFIEFSADGVIVNPLRISSQTVNELQYCLVLCYTGGTRMSSHIIEHQLQNYRDGVVDTIAAMDQLKEITISMKNALLRGQVNDFGDLLDEAWQNKKRMANTITNPFLDEVYGEALRSGALGGKISGAGGGGYMYFFCPGENRHRVVHRLQQMGLVVTRFAFEPAGVGTWDSEVRLPLWTGEALPAAVAGS